MKNITKYIFVGFVAFFPFWPASAAMNAYLKLDKKSDSISGEVRTTEMGTSSKTKDIDANDTDDTAAGPALLEIDPIRGESPESETQEGNTEKKQGAEAREKTVQYNESDLDFGQKNVISTKAREINGWDDEEKKDFLQAVKEHAQVESGQELENLARGVLLEDKNVKSIEASAEKVIIEYEMPARFLGIFNTSLIAHAGVARDGTVKVTFPWYSFLFKKLIVVSDIESEAKTGLPEIGDEVLVSFKTRALVIRMLSDIMKTKHDTVKNSIGNIR